MGFVPSRLSSGEIMTRNNETSIVHLSVRDWAGILGVVFTILSAFFIGTISIERRLT